MRWSEIHIAEELAEALAATPGAEAAFEALPAWQQREYAEHVLEKHRPEMRARRARHVAALVSSAA